MIKKLLGINDEQLEKKSNYYGYLFTALLGGLMIIAGITMIAYQYSDIHKNIIQKDYSYVNHLKKISNELNDETLPYVINAYEANINLVDERFRQDGLFFFLLGTMFLVNFILYSQLRSRVVSKKE